MPLNQTSGNATADSFGGGVAAIPNYIEDVFSPYIYTGTGATQTITNGIDLSTKGGLVWFKRRDAVDVHALIDTARGTNSWLGSERVAAPYSYNGFTSFNTTGFTLAAPSDSSTINGYARSLTSWTFRKQSKFFDIVTYTGNGSSGRTVSHNLGSTPGCIFIKKTSGASTYGWPVYHRGCSVVGSDYYNLVLNLSEPEGQTFNTAISSPTSTTFTVSNTGDVNQNGSTYVAYVFAHNAGGFGTSGTDNVITCGSYTGNGSTTGPVVTLGYEPQWLMIKRITTSTGAWAIMDNMRGFSNPANTPYLSANTNFAESANAFAIPTATGFQIQTSTSAINASGDTYIYIAIRKGPMKVPTDATKVFSPITTDNPAGTAFTSGFPIDLQWIGPRAGNSRNMTTNDRLRGVSTNATESSNYLISSSTAVENTATPYQTLGWGNTGFVLPNTFAYQLCVSWNFRRAPGFFDEVCYAGTGSATTFSHNLGVAPELMIVKTTNNTGYWITYSATTSNTKYLLLNTTAAPTTDADIWNNTSPTSSVFTVGSSPVTNGGSNYIAYLFASCPGVSKVGSYTGTGATQTIDCGFTGGARFVLVKRTSSSGDWYVWDTARGMVSGNDKSLKMNTVDAEVNANSIYTTTGGFQIVSTAAGINASGGTYIYLAIA